MEVAVVAVVVVTSGARSALSGGPRITGAVLVVGVVATVVVVVMVVVASVTIVVVGVGATVVGDEVAVASFVVVVLTDTVEVSSAKAVRIGCQKLNRNEVVEDGPVFGVDVGAEGALGDEVALSPTTFQRKVMPTRVMLPVGLKSGGKKPPQ